MKDGETLPIWAKLLIGFHLFAVITWTIPPTPQEIREGKRQPGTLEEKFLSFNDLYFKQSPTHTYLQTFGLWQSWDMFAPNPSARDVWGDAVVQFRDGSERVLEFPRTLNAPLWAKPVVERFRKYYEHASLPDYAYLWPSMAQWMASKAATDPKNPPIRVVVRRYLFIAPGTMTASEYFQKFGERKGIDKFFPKGPTVVPDYEPENMFIWIVDQDQLASDKGWSKP